MEFDLIFWGVMIAVLALGLAVIWVGDIEDDIPVGKFIAVLLILLIGIGMACSGAQNRAYKNALDGNNPYHKEYVYRDLPDGTKELTDSIYVK
jgi:predicted tellurium resistance membrane protein TerC